MVGMLGIPDSLSVWKYVVWNIEEKYERVGGSKLDKKRLEVNNMGLNISLTLKVISTEVFRLLSSRHFHPRLRNDKK